MIFKDKYNFNVFIEPIIMLLPEVIGYKTELQGIKDPTETKNKYILDIESSKSDPDYNRSARYVNIVVYPEEQKLFDTMANAKTPTLHPHKDTGVIYHQTNPNSDPLSFSKFSPPKKVLAITSFTLYKGTGDTLHKLHANRMMDVLKKRDPYNYISDVDYLDFIEAAIEQLSTFTKTSKKSSDDLTKLNSVLTKFNNDVFKSNNAVAILEAPSSGPLVSDVANKLRESIKNSFIVSGSLVKSLAPKTSDYQYSQYTDKERSNARKYTDKTKWPAGEFTLRKFGYKSKDYNKYYKAAYEEKGSDLSENEYIKLMQSKLADLVRHKMDIKSLDELRELAIEIEDQESINQYNSEIQEIQSDITDIENEFTRHGANPNRSALLQNIVNIRKYYRSTSRYVFLKEKQTAHNNLTHEEYAELIKLEKFLKIPGIEKRVSQLIDEIATMKFRIKTAQVSFYGRKGTDGPMAFGSYEIFKPTKDHKLDELNGKVVIIVDDNIVNGTSIADIVKTIFKAGVVPKEIYAFAPHAFKDVSEEKYQSKYTVPLDDATTTKIAALDAQITSIRAKIKNATDIAIKTGNKIDLDQGTSSDIAYSTLNDLKEKLAELENNSRILIKQVIKPLKDKPELRDITLFDEKIKFNQKNIDALVKQIASLSKQYDEESDKVLKSKLKIKISSRQKELDMEQNTQKELTGSIVDGIKSEITRLAKKRDESSDKKLKTIYQKEIDNALSRIKGLQHIDTIYSHDKKQAASIIDKNEDNLSKLLNFGRKLFGNKIEVSDIQSISK